MNTFGTIIVDPPWSYEVTTRKKQGHNYDPHQQMRGYMDRHYEALTTADLAALPVGDAARDDSVLLLWTTFPFVPDALKLIDAWGFTYVTGIPWVKANVQTGKMGYGVGWWFRGAAELVLVGKRKVSYRSQALGILMPPEDETDIMITPMLHHSRKPDDLHKHAEDTYPGPRLELFARRPREGWTTLGDDPAVGGGDIRDTLPAVLRDGASPPVSRSPAGTIPPPSPT